MLRVNFGRNLSGSFDDEKETEEKSCLKCKEGDADDATWSDPSVRIGRMKVN